MNIDCIYAMRTASNIYIIRKAHAPFSYDKLEYLFQQGIKNIRKSILEDSLLIIYNYDDENTFKSCLVDVQVIDNKLIISDVY